MGYWEEVGRDTGRKLVGILGGSWEDTGRIKGGTFYKEGRKEEIGRRGGK